MAKIVTTVHLDKQDVTTALHDYARKQAGDKPGSVVGTTLYRKQGDDVQKLEFDGADIELSKT